jgi:hypothetical protein
MTPGARVVDGVDVLGVVVESVDVVLDGMVALGPFASVVSEEEGEEVVVPVPQAGNQSNREITKRTEKISAGRLIRTTECERICPLLLSPRTGLCALRLLQRRPGSRHDIMRVLGRDGHRSKEHLMAYDPKVDARVEEIATAWGATRKKMFGGTYYLFERGRRAGVLTRWEPARARVPSPPAGGSSA